ncbi:MAG TPA: alpha/beta fold hydrolase, partial [Verrucomicrobiae bacterium]|nr:alpha/beta fold hydrolase [Verrucomicrobiae bacterium]
MPEEKIARVHGSAIRYVEAGTGEAVVLLHGLGGSRLSFSANMRALSARHRVVALDQIGFGRSDKPAIDYTAATFVDHLSGFLREIGIDAPSLVGNSLGGEVAMRFALRWPERLHRLVLVASGGIRHEEGAEWGEVDPTPPTMEEMREFLLSLFHDAALVTDDLVRLAFENHEACGDAATIRRFRARRKQEQPLRDSELASLRAPTLIVWGREDRLTPISLGKRLHDAISGSRLAVIERCGHLPMVEKAAEFNGIVTAFLGE